MQPIIKKCWSCGGKVFEFEDNHFGCDNCKSVWTYDGKGWKNIHLKDKRNKIENGRDRN